MKFFKEKKYEALRQYVLVFLIFYLSTVLEHYISGKRYDNAFPVKWMFILLPVYFSCIAFAIVAHYYWLYDRYAVHKKYKKYLLLLAGFMILMILLDVAASCIINALHVWETKEEPIRFFKVAAERVFIADMPFAYVYAAIRHYNKTKREQKKLELEDHKNEMMLLRSKLEPEFIYNTLNMLQETAKNEQARKTADFMSELKELFRYSTADADKEKIPAEKELDFIQRYVRLQKMRIVNDRNIRIEEEVSWDEMPANIAPMLLLPFIENAFKYGISYEQSSTVNININMTGDVLLFNCNNTDHAGKSEVQSTGTGLANTIKRLDLQYKDKYQLEQGSKNGLYAVSLRLELN